MANDFQRQYFDAYAYDTIWSLANIYQQSQQTNINDMIDNIDFHGATVRSKMNEQTFVYQ
jgi:hypothetical protein